VTEEPAEGTASAVDSVAGPVATWMARVLVEILSELLIPLLAQRTPPVGDSSISMVPSEALVDWRLGEPMDVTVVLVGRLSALFMALVSMGWRLGELADVAVVLVNKSSM
jgi:hypothetical protein